MSGTPAKPIGKFVKGETYYQCYKHRDTVIVNTWTFEGLFPSDCSSTSCDVPYHFYRFQILSGEAETGFRLRVPSLKQAELTYLTWDEFCVAFGKLVDPAGANKPRLDNRQQSP